MALDKGVFSLLFMAGILMVAIAIVTTVGSSVLDDVRETLLLSERITNQSVTFTNNTGHALTNTFVGSIVRVANATVTYTSGNYTLTAGQDSSSLLININCGGDGAAASGNCTGIGSALNVTYDRLSKTSGSLAVRNSTESLGNLQIPNIGTVVGAIIVIFIVFFIIGVVANRGVRRGE